MKLTEKEIGKQVRRKSSSTPYGLIGVHGNELWITAGYGNTSLVLNSDEWIVVEPEKKPSTKISDLYDKEPKHLTTTERWIFSVIKFLDEQFESREK